MKYNPDIHNRQSIRLKGYDYSQQGMYFITICTYNREYLFGNIETGKIFLSDIGIIADKYWREIPAHFLFVKLDEFVIMPNHIHGIIEIVDCLDRRDAINRVPTIEAINTNKGGITKEKNPMLNPFSLSTIIRWFKGRTTFEVNKSMNNINFAWQSRFYDHIIRKEEDLNKIREYIINNPLKWNEDEYYK